jgi:dTDP-4-amino-4,6-dideoxygalactose transaminase
MARSGKTRIIGGMFGLEMGTPQPCSQPPFLKEGHVYLANARSGIFLLCKCLSPPSVWIPSYLCGSMVEALEKAQARTKYYEVDYHLNVTSLGWLESVQRDDLVILVDYFGFPCDPTLAACVKARGAWVLEDACQALLSGQANVHSDFVLFSPKKFLGVPDGGILVFKRDMELGEIRLQSPPASWWLKTLRSTVLRRQFDISGGDREWLHLFQETGLHSPIGFYAMSELSKTLLVHGFDYPAIAKRRIHNFEVLDNQLGDLALFSCLPEKTVPLGFPIRLKNRGQVRQLLFEHDIYPPVHWPIQALVPKEFRESHRLAAEIMTLPCDQRYDSQEMKRMASLVLKGAEL